MGFIYFAEETIQKSTQTKIKRKLYPFATGNTLLSDGLNMLNISLSIYYQKNISLRFSSNSEAFASSLTIRAFVILNKSDKVLLQFCLESNTFFCFMTPTRLQSINVRVIVVTTSTLSFVHDILENPRLELQNFKMFHLYTCIQ